MRPYQYIKLEEYPDVADIQSEGRKTAIGGKDYFRKKVSKRQARRYLKRQDRHKAKLCTEYY